MSPKSYRLIFASQSSTGLPSGFSKGSLGLYIGKSVRNKNQTFNNNTPVLAISQWENFGLLVLGGLLVRNHKAVINVSPKVNFDDALSTTDLRVSADLRNSDSLSKNKSSTTPQVQLDMVVLAKLLYQGPGRSQGKVRENDSCKTGHPVVVSVVLL